jgi:hypothetical protein
LKIIKIWDITTCRLVEGYQSLEKTSASIFVTGEWASR